MPAPRSPSGSSPLRSLGYALIAGIAVLSLSYGAYWALGSFIGSGGWEGIRAAHQPSPAITDPAVSSRRDAAVAAIEDNFARISARLPLRAGQSGSHAGCHQGQHNYKVNDDYAYSCAVWAGRFYGWSGEFPDFLVRFDAVMYDQGWMNTEAASLITRYHDNIARLTKQGMAPAKAKVAAIDRLYSVSYYRGSDQLDVDFAGSTKPSDSDKTWMWLSEDVDSKAAVGDLLKNDTGVMLIRGHREFFRN